MELKWYERIALIVHYLMLASGYIGLLLWVWVELEHGEVLVAVLGFALVRFWFYVYDVSNKKRAIERRERQEIKCSSCKYMKENERR